MKTVGKRSAFLYLLIAFFCIGICYFTVTLLTNGSAWSSMPYNGHLSDEDAAASRGTIKDRNGVVLFSDKDGYNNDTKEALLHVTGDTDGFISTGIMKMYTSNLSGYNFITGLSTVNGLQNGGVATLTVDSKVSEKAYELLSGYKGAAFIYNYKTGEILCQTSTPSFDPENIPDDIDSNENYDGAFLDRAISCTFTPGSVFKIVTTICAVENMDNWQDFTAQCDGECYIGDSRVTCLENHGEIGIEDGLMYSCNILFANLALELGEEKLTKTANELGFGKAFNYEASVTAASNFDLTDADDIAVAWSGIGQYTDLVSPYHMAVIAGSVANGGTSASPYIVEKISSSIGIPTKTAARSSLSSFMDANTADTVKALLRNNVVNYYGDSMFPGMNVCAKTGTAEVGDGKNDTAWMVGFSENENTPYAFAVVVEEGGSGYRTAGSIASELMQMLS